MSYILHIWDTPVPGSVAEADQIHTHLSAMRTAQNPTFLELAKRLTDRYPCISTLDEDDTEAAWSDGPLDGVTQSPVYSVGVQTGMLQPVVPFLAATANALGLVVYDMQAGEVHLPHGRILTLAGRKPAIFAVEPTEQDLISRTNVAQMIREGLRALMESYGFKTLKGSVFFRKRFAQCAHEVLFDLVDYHPTYEIVLIYLVDPHLEERLAQLENTFASDTCAADLGKIGDMTRILAPGEKRLWERKWSVEDTSSLLTMIEQLREFLSAAVLPVMMKFDTIDSLDCVINQRPADENPFVPDNMDILLACATHNPGLGALVNARVRAAEPGYVRERLCKLLTALDLTVPECGGKCA